MVIIKRIIFTSIAFTLIFSACTPMGEREPVTQPWEEQEPMGIPTETLVPTQQLSLTPVPEILLVEPTSIAVTATPFSIDEQTTDNLFALPSEDEHPVYGLYGYPQDYNPLTGERVNNPDILNRRPILTKISNFPAVGRPHAGLSYADVVFEYYIGQFTNRFLALYYGDDAAKAWPLRSGRLVDPQIATMFQGILVYGNADEARTKSIQDILGENSLSFNESPCPPICGYATHDATGVYVITDEVSKYYDRVGRENEKPYLNNWLFDNQPPFSNQYAMTVGVEYINWNRGEWRYDPQSGKYLRWIESWEYEDFPLIPLVDQLNNEQIAYSNIVILFAEYIELAPTAHDVKFWSNTYGEKAYFFRDGLLVEGGWYVPDRNKPMVFLNKDGTPYRLKPGNTWIVIAGLASEFKQLGVGEHYLYFDYP
ncbi:MAG: DUF3048 C-terminal domain-containing protein [Anaerolineaceae bacterium]|nr:DUF3048 C-terminal domain-containing protein [Anaerolineaceae bacterium]